METLARIYQRYIQNYFIYQDHKCFINILAKLFIYVFATKYYIQAIVKNDDEKENYYCYVFDILLSEWNLIYPRYQLIIKANAKKMVR